MKILYYTTVILGIGLLIGFIAFGITFEILKFMAVLKYVVGFEFE